MADLRRRGGGWWEPTRSARPRDRAQVILITGFVLAVTFVALALILNSVIFTENLATRSESVGGSGPTATNDIVRSGVGDLMASVNENNGTVGDSDQVGVLRNGTENLSEPLGAQFAFKSQSVEIAYRDVTNGTRYVQNNSKEYESGDGDINWTVVNGTAILSPTSPLGKTFRIRDFKFNVSRTSLPDNASSGVSCPFGRCFRVNVTEAGTSAPVWGVSLYRNSSVGSGAVVVTSYSYAVGRSIIGKCTIRGDNVRVSLSTGRVGNASNKSVRDSSCQAISFPGNVSAPYNVTYWNGDKASGNYSLITDRNRDLGLASLGTNLAPPSSGDSPRATHAVYETFVNTTYVVERTEYNTTIRVAPGEPR